jgi:hypothetical protein
LALVLALLVVVIGLLALPRDAGIEGEVVQLAPADGHRVQVGIAYGDRLPSLSPADRAAALDDAVTVGATLVRADLAWPDIQPDGPATYRWDNYDRVVDEADARGLQVLPILAYTPAWARPRCGSDMCPPADPARFAAFAKAAAQRYAPRGVHRWEIWNEPNLRGFWQPNPDPVGFARLVTATAAAIRSVDPGAYLVLGGLAAATGGNGKTDALDYLDRVCTAGACGVVDAIGYHPYTYPFLASMKASWITPWNRIRYGTRSVRSVLAKHGHASMPVWITEFGAPTGGPGPVSDGSARSLRPTPDHVTEARQAALAADAVGAAAVDPLTPVLIWYSQRDLSTATGTTENSYGLRRADGSAKPALAALRDAVSRENRR